MSGRAPAGGVSKGGSSRGGSRNRGRRPSECKHTTERWQRPPSALGVLLQAKSSATLPPGAADRREQARLVGGSRGRGRRHGDGPLRPIQRTGTPTCYLLMLKGINPMALYSDRCLPALAPGVGEPGRAASAHAVRPGARGVGQLIMAHTPQALERAWDTWSGLRYHRRPTGCSGTFCPIGSSAWRAQGNRPIAHCRRASPLMRSCASSSANDHTVHFNGAALQALPDRTTDARTRVEGGGRQHRGHGQDRGHSAGPRRAGRAQGASTVSCRRSDSP